MRALAAATLCALVVAASAAAEQTQQVVLPGPVPYPTDSPPLVGQGTLANAYMAPGLHIASAQLVRVGVDASGRPARVSVRQRLVVRGKGDYQVAVSGPVASVRPAPGTESEPGFRTDQVLWAGFSPGRKILAADVGLRLEPAAHYLPLRLRLRPEGDGVSLTVANATVAPVLSYEGVVRAAEMARLLDATRRSSLAGQRVKAAFATFYGPVRNPTRPVRIEAPLLVEGTLQLPGGQPVRFSRILGDGQPLTFTVHASGSGKPVVHLTARPAPVIDLLRPPGAPTWSQAVRRRHLGPAALLSRLLGARQRLVRADQYQSYLADPDSDGRSRAVYEYRTVATAAPRSVPAPAGGGSGSHALLIALVALGSVAVVGGGLVVWAHS
ncbi:MAG TPA: hypothetical protein VI142_04085 [Gaiellaceae bacterium]